MQYFFLTWQAVNRVKILHLAVEAGQTGLKSRGIWFVVIPGALNKLGRFGAWLVPNVIVRKLIAVAQRKAGGWG